MKHTLEIYFLTYYKRNVGTLQKNFKEMYNYNEKIMCNPHNLHNDEKTGKYNKMFVNMKKKMSKKHFTKRKANGQYAYGKILISHHGNLNQNHREILFHT